MRTTTLLLLITAAGTSACAGLVHGTKQEIRLSSAPTNARVTIDSVEVGNTPVVTWLPRGNTHTVKIELDGFQPFETKLSRTFSPATLFNILWAYPGIAFIAIDALSGAMYNLAPAQLTAQMARRGAAINRAPDGLTFVLVERADSSWTRIGQLTRTK